MTAGIYFHYPFCLKKCNYCDFTSFVSSENKEEDIIDTMIQEKKSRSSSRFKEFEYDTIYFGGGTPSLMKPEFMNRILESLLSETGFLFSKNLEITLEANPETVSRERAFLWKKMGVNRVSMGAQSSDDQVLAQSGRVHSSRRIQDALNILRDSGINNINLDFILGLPGETDLTIQKNLDMISLLSPDHLSIYFLTINEHTRLFEQITQGEIMLPVEEKVVSRWQTYIKSLPSMGFEHYEISNFAKTGKQSRHNLHYWHLDPYFAIGCSAVGFDGFVRYTNPKNLKDYQKSDFTKISAKFYEKLTPTKLKREKIMLGLRLLQEGIDKNLIHKNKEEILSQWTRKDFLVENENRVLLTEKGVLFSNQVISSLF